MNGNPWRPHGPISHLACDRWQTPLLNTPRPSPSLPRLSKSLHPLPPSSCKWAHPFAHSSTIERHTHARCFFFLDDNMSFIFYIFKGLLFTNKINKKKSKRFFDKHCLSAYCCKKVYINLSFHLYQVTNRYCLSLGSHKWAEQWPCEWALRGPSSSPRSPAPPSTAHIISKHMKTCGEPNEHLVSSSLGIILSSFCISSLLFF